MESLAETVKIMVVIAVAGLAGVQVADTWLNGSIFSKPTNWLKRHRDGSWLAQLLTCLFCLRHWTTAAFLLVLLLEAFDKLPSPGLMFIYWAAAVGFGSLFEREEPEEVLDLTEDVEAALEQGEK